MQQLDNFSFPLEKERVDLVRNQNGTIDQPTDWKVCFEDFLLKFFKFFRTLWLIMSEYRTSGIALSLCNPPAPMEPYKLARVRPDLWKASY